MCSRPLAASMRSDLPIEIDVRAAESVHEVEHARRVQICIDNGYLEPGIYNAATGRRVFNLTPAGELNRGNIAALLYQGSK